MRYFVIPFCQESKHLPREKILGFVEFSKRNCLFLPTLEVLLLFKNGFDFSCAFGVGTFPEILRFSILRWFLSFWIVSCHCFSANNVDNKMFAPCSAHSFEGKSLISLEENSFSINCANKLMRCDILTFPFAKSLFICLVNKF